MPSAVVLIHPSYASHQCAGQSIEWHWQKKCEGLGWDICFIQANHEAVQGPTVLIDGRFLALSPERLSHLITPNTSGISRLLSAPDTPVAVHLATDVSRTAEALLQEAGEDRVLSNEEALRIDVPIDRVRIERSIRREAVRQFEANGVHWVDPDRVVVDSSVQIAAGALIWPDVVLRGQTVVHAHAEIQSGCWLVDTSIGEGAVVKPHCVCEGAVIGNKAQVGPMAHLRQGTFLEEEVKVGNFVEVKKTTLKRGAKASHLSYLGDSIVGEEANVGAGTITCNYDGHRKQRTSIGARAFIGSNTCLVAPVSVGDGAIVGAGTVVTRDIAEEALAVARAPLKTLEGRAPRIHARNKRMAAQDKNENP